MKAIRELSMLIASMGIVAAVMAAYFDWRGRLLSRVRDFRKEE